MVFGMDIGTTQSKQAYVDPSGKPVIIPNARGEQVTPSAIYLPQDGEPLIGTDAKEQGLLDPSRCVNNFKLKLGSTESLLSAGPAFTPTDAADTIIATLKRDAENYVGIEMKEVVATCPANFRDNKKQALLEAFERNGIKVVRLMPEPTAAAFSYCHEKSFNKSTIVVYDFGGGTFDVSVVRVDGSEMTVLATEGVPQLGGNDISNCLRNRVLDEIEKTCSVRPSPESEDGMFMLDLTQRIEAAKVSLGTRKEVPVVASYRGQQVIVKIKQEEFHTSISSLVARSFEAVDRAVTSASLKIEEVDRLIMVGGTSRLPFIQEKLANHTGMTPHIDIDPEKAIAYGAALACVSEMAKAGKAASLGGRAIPSPDLFARDVAAHSVGCCITDNSGPQKRLLNWVLIPKNTPIPCVKTDCFYLEQEDQTAAQIEILQGEHQSERDKCLFIGELKLEDLPKESKRTERIQVEYGIDANGMVNATATDKTSGKQQTVSVDYKKGIHPKQKPAMA